LSGRILSDFLNWAIIDSGAFDYAADAWGYTRGAALELSLSQWTVRGGVFVLSKVVERRTEVFGHAGKVKLLGFVNRGDMARYDDAIRSAEINASVPDVASVRHYASRPGVARNIEQELTASLGIFLRASANDGSKEAYEFTEINKSLAVGLALKGAAWNRKDDGIGVAGAVSGISSAARRYFAAGGQGILIGDGGLARYGSEDIVEAYYSVGLTEHVTVAADLQRVVHPAYNRDRGPVSVFGFRAHAEF
jgi:high affinity Mn2+ porin